MDTTIDWRIELPPNSRQKIIDKITKTLEKSLPYSGAEGMHELKSIAVRFEEKIYISAVNQTDYLRKISMKMLSMENQSHNSALSFSSLAAANENQALNPGHLMNNDSSNPSRANEEPTMNTADWRNQLPPDTRHTNINNLMETLKKHVPYSGQEGIEELMRIAISFEDLIFNTALNQVDYFLKISSKMQNMEKGD